MIINFTRGAICLSNNKRPGFLLNARRLCRLFTRPRNPDTWRRDRQRFNFFSHREFDRVPYIIRRKAESAGLFSYFITILGGIAYADRHNLIPVVDMKHYSNPYLYPDETGKINAWEYYFTQPGNIALDDALSCKKYILGRDTAKHVRPEIVPEFFYGQRCKTRRLDYWRKICKQYIRFTPAVIERLNALKQKYHGRRILGVLLRGTDYTALKPSGHYIPPTAEQAISKSQEVMRGENFDSIYLATEDKNILAKFQAAFGDKLLLPEADYINYDYEHARLLADCDDINKYLRGLEYLVSMLFLAKFCKGFVTCMVSGSAGVMCLSEDFDYLYVFDLGLYP